MPKLNPWNVLLVPCAITMAIVVGVQTETPHVATATTEAAGASPDLNGEWRLDRARSDVRARRLPDRLHVAHTSALVSFADSTGRVLVEVSTVSAAADTFAHAPGADHRRGSWDGKSLVLNRERLMGGKVMERWSLGNDGETLVAMITTDGNEARPGREFKRVYERVNEP
jgi:hypothetical protein